MKKLLARNVVSAVTLSAIFMLAGCANWEGRKLMMEKTYHGKHIDNAYKQLGVPVGRVNLKSGGQVVEFITYRGPYRCEDKFITDESGTVISSEHTGQNGCVTP